MQLTAFVLSNYVNLTFLSERNPFVFRKLLKPAAVMQGSY